MKSKEMKRSFGERLSYLRTDAGSIIGCKGGNGCVRNFVMNYCGYNGMQSMESMEEEIDNTLPGITILQTNH